MASRKRRTKAAKMKESANIGGFGKHDKKLLYPRNSLQKLYMEYMDVRDIVFATGLPGTSKSLLALYKAFQMLDNREIEHIYVAKPKVKIPGENDLGALPGTLEEKTEPYLTSVIDALSVFMSPSRIEMLMKSRGKFDSQIDLLPLDFLRGRTLPNSFILIDEAQNITSHTMYTILSRIGTNSKIVITGDTVQRDLRSKYGASGLEDSIRRLSHFDEVGVVNFDKLEYVERSPLAKKLIGAYLDLYN